MKNYAFIDSQNLNLGIRSLGWKLDFFRLRIFLKDKYNIEQAFIFIGYLSQNEYLYRLLRKAGYKLIFKPTVQTKGVVKGNCDAELVMHCMLEKDNFEKAMIISGDGDFHCLITYLSNNNKLLKVGIPNKKSYSGLLRKFRHPYFWYIQDSKSKISYTKKTKSG